MAHEAFRANFREFVRVRFDGGGFAGDNESGCRASDKVEWRMRSYWVRGPAGFIIDDTASTSSSDPRGNPGPMMGTVTVTPTAGMTTEGFSLTYSSAANVWTLLGSSGGAFPSIGAGPWTVTVPQRVTVTINQAAPGLPWPNGSVVDFSVFTTTSSLGKQKVWGEGAPTAVDGP